jgi:hypothetical protein
MSIQHGSWLNELGKSREDFRESQEKFMAIYDDLTKSSSRELLYDQKTGDPFYHVLTNDGREEIITRKSMLNAFVDYNSKFNALRENCNKALKDYDIGTLQMLKTANENIKVMKKLLGFG